MFYREESVDRGEGEEVPRLRSSHIEALHRALFRRVAVLQKEHPGARVEQEVQDSEPRAVLWIVAADGTILAKEFLETSFSADIPDRDGEYIDAARRYDRLAVHYPGLIMSQEYVINRISDLWVKIRDREVQRRVTIQGFLYGDDGSTILTM
ncbi:MAG: hypothetical protein ISF22_06430 [Methanomassiliicoccus sp.]|nr:hypothetical protein [Methanomassiliicoccus sp.]